MGIMKLPLLLVCLIYVSYTSSRTVSVIKNSRQEPEIVDGIHPDAIVTSTFNNTYNQTGWSILEIHGVAGKSNNDIAYYAGYVEGALTAELIYMTYLNSGPLCSGDKSSSKSGSKFCEDANSFVDSNLDYMNTQINDYPDSVYWALVELYLTQLEGLAAGYNSNNDSLPTLSTDDFLYLQIDNDLGNLQQAFSSGSFPRFNPNIGDGKCSAFVKILPEYSDLLTTHDTWSEYQSMLRIYKLYDLPYRMSWKYLYPGRAISMPSYPGKLQSEDDYYIINSNLVTMETTNGNSNPDLWNDLSPSTVFEPIRVMVANRLARSGREWTQLFAQYNSGTYNNQWMIVDYNAFEPGAEQPPSADLLWILEQLPGYIIYGDETRVLVNQSYWASYNIPYYSSIFEASGMPAYVDKYGEWFSHSGSPRAKIFARNHSDVVDMDSLIKLMRYNDFKHDPLSVCNCTPPYSGENAISARSDLNPADGKFPFSALSHRIHGGTDNKATNYQMVKSLQSMATCGPTHDQQPVFTWSGSGVDKPMGHVDKFDFPTIQIKWDELPPPQ